MDSQSNNEAIILLSNEMPYFEEIRQAAQIRKCFKGKNVEQFSDSKRKIIREKIAQAGTLEKNARSRIEKAIIDGTFYVHGEAVEIKSDDAKSIINIALKQLVEGVYTRLNNVNVYQDSDADILRIQNGDMDEGSMPGTGCNNEYALGDISQWLEVQTTNHVPVTMGDVHKRYQDIPYGWREIDIAALVARLIVNQKISIKYGGAVVAKDDRRLVEYLRLKSERDKATVTRRIAPSEDLMRKSVTFLREWLSQMDVPGDEDGLIAFVKDIIEKKRDKYQDLLNNVYSQDRYPDKELVNSACDLMGDILSQARDNVALLNRLIAKQDDLRDISEDMENVLTFFNPNSQQKAIFDAARDVQKKLQNERGYFVSDTETIGKIDELISILSMPKPYDKIRDLTDLTQIINTAYGVLLEQKKEEVRNMITQCMGDVHTLAGTAIARDEVKKADDEFMRYKQSASDAESLTLLDAMITQLLNYKDSVCRQIESMQHRPGTSDGGAAPAPQKIAQIRRYEVFPVKRLQSKEDVDGYLDGIKKKLYDTLENNDGIQIN